MSQKKITEQRIRACQITIDKSKKKIEKYKKSMESRFTTEQTKEQLQKKIDKQNEKINKHQAYIDNPKETDDMIQQYKDNSIFTKAGNNITKSGESLKKFGDKTSKFGMHATGIVWTPVLYVGYQSIKKSRKNKKEKEFQEDVHFYKETRGTDNVLVGLVKECEEAYNEGKIDKEQFKHFLNDYIDNMY